MIKLEVTGKCINCPAMELKLERLIMQSFDGDRYVYSLVCENNGLCEAIESRLKQETDG